MQHANWGENMITRVVGTKLFVKKHESIQFSHLIIFVILLQCFMDSNPRKTFLDKFSCRLSEKLSFR